jgi:WD40 repeat protein
MDESNDDSIVQSIRLVNKGMYLMKAVKIVLMMILIAIFPVYLQAQGDKAYDDDRVYITAVDWSHDGTKLVAVGLQYGGLQGYLNILDMTTGATFFEFNPIPGGFSSVAWSPDDRFIAVGGYDQVIWIFDAEKRMHITSLFGHQSTVNAVDWSRDGMRLVSGGDWDQQVILWDMATYQPLQIVEAGDIRSVAFSPDNRQIAVGSIFGLGIFPASLDTSGINEPKPNWFTTLNVGSVAWNSIGTRVAIGTLTTPDVTDLKTSKLAQVYVFDSQTGQTISTITTKTEAIYGLAWSPDDSLIAIHSIDGVMKIFDVESAEVLQEFPGTTVFAVDLSFSPYGGRLAYGGVLPGKQNTVVDLLPVGVNTLVDGGIRMVVPNITPAYLNGVSNLCANSNKTDREDLQFLRNFSHSEANTLPDFITQVKALPEGAIPPACAADLIAVAEAILAQP